MANIFLRTVLVLGAISLTSTLPTLSYAQGAEGEVQYRQISMEYYRDKVAGGWLGQAIGVLCAMAVFVPRARNARACLFLR